MNLEADKLKLVSDHALTPDQQTLLHCQAAADFIEAGQHEAACAALGDLWRGAGVRPPLQGLNEEAAAELLLQCGVLTGWVGSCQHITEAQEPAKDLISEALRRFQVLGQSAKVVEAQYELGICYWRLGAFDEARVVLDEALKSITEANSDLKAKTLIRRALIETWACRYHDAWEVLKSAGPFFERLTDAYKGRWHGEMGNVLLFLGIAQGRAAYLDRAIIEYTAAIFHYEQAKHERYRAVNLNNLAFLFYSMGRYAEAHENLDRATAIFSRLGDPGNVAQVWETRARVLLAEQRHQEALPVIDEAVRVFERGGEQAFLADALVVQATILARLGEHARSLEEFRRALDVAEMAGSLEKAGHAALSMLEEHGDGRLSAREVYETYRRADDLLKNTQDAEDIRRLRDCARLMGRRLAGPELDGPGFSLPAVIREHEARFIEEALERTDGSVTRAAKLLGYKYQALAALLKTRHKQLLHKRAPVVPRRRSIIRLRGARARAGCQTPKTARNFVILHVEDNGLVADAVKETLEMESWQTEVCADGLAGLERLESESHYDLLITDNMMPGMNGVELVRRARQLPHRRHVPIIMLSAIDAEDEANRAGVDLFLKKPGDMLSLVEAITQLLAAG
jgi:CheY-like chemotaxis protein